VSAIFCANDTSACGAADVCRERGLRIPHDISIIGVDDTQDGKVMTPPLTTIRLPRHDIGTRAAEKLIAMVQGRTSSHSSTVLPVELVVRGTTAKPGLAV
jgi:DNA-binding LacI/PurR family transcriptional regulator